MIKNTRVKAKKPSKPQMYSAADFFSFFMSDSDFRQRAVNDMMKNPAFVSALERGFDEDSWLEPVMFSARNNGFEFSEEEFVQAVAQVGIPNFVNLLREVAGGFLHTAESRQNVKNVWKWSGAYYGYIENDNLWTKEGSHTGKIIRDEIYDLKGHYIGELQNGDRLIADKRKLRLKKHLPRTFSKLATRAATSTLGNKPSAGTKPDYQDFSD